jgi:hypothetical protein
MSPQVMHASSSSEERPKGLALQHEDIDATQLKLAGIESAQGYKELWSKKVNLSQDFCFQKAKELEDHTVLENGLKKIGHLLALIAELEYKGEQRHEAELRNLKSGLNKKIDKLMTEPLVQNEQEALPDNPEIYPDIPREDVQGFAEIRTRDEFHDMVEGMQNEAERKEFLQQVMSGLSEGQEMEVVLSDQQMRRLEQLEFLEVYLNAVHQELGLTDTGASTSGRKISNHLEKMLGGQFEEFAAIISLSLEELDGAQMKLMLNPDMTLMNIVPSLVLFLEAHTSSTKEGMLSFTDPTSPAALSQQKLTVMKHLRNLNHYEEIRSYAEQMLSVEIRFGVQQIEPSHLREIEREASEEVDRMVAKHIDTWRRGSTDNKTGQFSPAMTEQQIKHFITQVKYENIERKKNEIALKEHFSPDALSPHKREVWDLYEDVFNPLDDPFNLTDAAWDTIMNEMMINAPLMILSGGIGPLLARGISRFAITTAVRIGVTGGRTAAQIYRGAKMAYDGSRIIRMGALTAEGVSFAVTHSYLAKQIGVSEEWLADMHLPQAMQEVFWSIVALKVFKDAGKWGQRLGKKIDNQLAQSFLKGQSFANPDKAKAAVTMLSANIRDAATRQLIQKTLELNIEAGVMLLLGAVQRGFYDGNLDEFFANFEEELFHAYVTAFSLKAAHGAVTQVGGAKQRARTEAVRKSRQAAEREVMSQRVAQAQAATTETVQPRTFTRGETVMTPEGRAEIQHVNPQTGEVTVFMRDLGVAREVSTETMRQMTDATLSNPEAIQLSEAPTYFEHKRALARVQGLSKAWDYHHSIGRTMVDGVDHVPKEVRAAHRVEADKIFDEIADVMYEEIVKPRQEVTEEGSTWTADRLAENFLMTAVESGSRSMNDWSQRLLLEKLLMRVEGKTDSLSIEYPESYYSLSEQKQLEYMRQRIVEATKKSNSAPEQFMPASARSNPSIIPNYYIPNGKALKDMMGAMGYTEVKAPKKGQKPEARPEPNYEAMDSAVAADKPAKQGLSKSALSSKIKRMKERLAEGDWLLVEGVTERDIEAAIDVLDSVHIFMSNNPGARISEVMQICFPREQSSQIPAELSYFLGQGINRLYAANLGVRRPNEIFRIRAAVRKSLSPEEKSLPAAEQNAIIQKRLYEILNYQTKVNGSVAAAVELHFRQNKNATYQEVVDAILRPEITEYMSQADRYRIKKNIAETIKKRDAIRKHTEGLTPNQIVENMFGFKPEGKVRVFTGPFTVFIDFANTGDYIRAVAGKKITPAEVSAHSYNSTGGCALPYSPNSAMPELAGVVTLGNHSIKDKSLETFAHEERHQINRGLEGGHEIKTARNRAHQRAKLGTDPVGMFEARQRAVEASTELLSLAKNEILAYIKGGSSLAHTVSTLTNRSESANYDYSKTYREYFQKHFEGRSGQGELFKDSFLALTQELYTAQVEAHANLAYSLYREAKTPAEQAAVLNQLAITPVRHWKKVFNHEWAGVVAAKLKPRARTLFYEQLKRFLKDGTPYKLEHLEFQLNFYEREFGISRQELFAKEGRRSLNDLMSRSVLSDFISNHEFGFDLARTKDSIRMLVGLKLITAAEANQIITKIGDKDIFMRTAEDYIGEGYEFASEAAAEAAFDSLIGAHTYRVEPAVFKNTNPDSLVVGEHLFLRGPDGREIEGVVLGVSNDVVTFIGRDTAAAPGQRMLPIPYEFLVGFKKQNMKIEAPSELKTNLPEQMSAAIQHPQQMYNLMVEAATGDTLIGEILHPDGSVLRVEWPVVESRKGSAELVDLAVGEAGSAKAKLRYEGDGTAYMTYKAPNSQATVELRLRRLSLTKAQ